MKKINKVLAIGAHVDDIELYCGGTLLKLQDNGSKIFTLVCSNGGEKGEDRIKESKIVGRFLNIWSSYCLDFKDSQLEHNFELISAIDRVVKKVEPDWIFTHSVNDYHQDHIAVAKATRSANRTQKATLITYPSYNVTIPFEANLFVDIGDYFDKKMRLLKVFKSQKDKWYMRPEVIEARSRGTNIARHIEKFKIELMLA